MTEQFPDDTREIPRSQNEDGSWNFAQLDIGEISFKGRFGALADSFSEHSATIGIKDFLLVQDFETIRVGDDVQITALADSGVYLWGEVVGLTSSDGSTTLSVFVDDISAIGSDATYTLWEIQVVARPKPGIEKDTSTTSVNPTTGGPWTFTVTAGKFFPIGGTLLIKPTADREIALIGEVKAYSGTSLTVSLRTTNATVSQNYSSWSIALLDSPPAAMPLLSIVGLRYAGDGNFRIKIFPGNVMDSTGRYLLTLDTALVKLGSTDWAVGDGQGGVVRVPLTGTVTRGVDSITGTGTSFTTVLSNPDVSPYGYLNDYAAQGETPNSSDKILGHISTADSLHQVNTINSNTSLSTTNTGAVPVTNAPYFRNGLWRDAASGNQPSQFLVLIRKDTDGSIDACLTAPTPSGEPDLPSGYTHYRVLGRVQVNGRELYDDFIVQPLYSRQEPFAPARAYYVLGAQLGEHIEGLMDNHLIFGGSSSISVTFPGANQIATALINNGVTNSHLADMEAYTIKGRNAGTTGDPSNISIPALTTKATPATGDYVLITDGAASNAFKKVDVSTLGGGTSFPTDMGLITEAATTTYDLGTIV